MANMLDWNVLDSKVKNYLNPGAGLDTPQKAFPVLLVATILDVTDGEAEDAITDGGNDRGVDAVFVDDRDGRNSIHVFQFKYVNNFHKSKNNFPSIEIDKLVAFFADVLDKEASLQKSCNQLLWNKVGEIWEALNKPKPSFEVHFCGNLAAMCEDEKKRANTSLCKFNYFNVHHHSLDSIAKLFVEKKTPKINRELNIVDKDYFDRSDGQVRGLICTVEAKEIIRLITDPSSPNMVLESIFNDNVRVYLNRTNRINRRIMETALSNQNVLFWYLNNGITITCDSFSYAKGTRGPKVELENVQIVNGGQTSNALFEAYQQDPEKLDDVLVLIRIIETKSKPISVSIAESTNSQTPIKSRDLRSNDEIQKKLEEAFLNMDLYYERKSKQHKDMPSDKRIDALVAGQAHLAYGMGMPEVAKKDRGRIFSDLYEQVFSDDINANQLIVAYQLLGLIETEKRDLRAKIRNQQPVDKSKMYLIDGAYHTLYAIGELCERNDIDALNFKAASRMLKKALTAVSTVVAAEQKRDGTFSFNRFFKDAKTKSKIAAQISNAPSK